MKAEHCQTTGQG